MNTALSILWLPLAVHIPDGLLALPWLLAGFALAGLLALLASCRIRDEEIPRIALFSAAFFVASLMHLPVGPTSVHLLLNGLVGVILGRRAPLAILIGLGLQAILFGHGGLTTIGVNACVQIVPATLAAWLFAGLCRFPSARRGNKAALWIMGFFIGASSVLATLSLEAVVLLWGGSGNWFQVVRLLFIAHLPVVAIEGIVLGFTIIFLYRVKPEMLPPLADGCLRHAESGPAAQTAILKPQNETSSPAVLSALLVLLLATSYAHGHRLNAGYVVLSDRQVRIESWFDLGGVPKGATVEVFRPGQRLLTRGTLDENGGFTFRYSEIESLEVIVSAGDAHRRSFVIPQADLAQPGATPSGTATSPTAPAIFRMIDTEAVWRERLKDALIGMSFLFSLAAFILSWRMSRKVRTRLEYARDEERRN
jgi:cobalt/nickel transport system permease protein